MNEMKKKALIIIDVQNDFMPGGPLGVPGGDEIVASINKKSLDFEHVIATQDWHPKDHGSFAMNNEDSQEWELGELGGLPQVMWPVHCVADSEGAELVKTLNKKALSKIIYKGTDPKIDSYSGFFDNDKKRSTGLGDYLRELSVVEVHIVGVATDYCVKFTALDAMELGFKVIVHKNCIRGVELNPGDIEKALEEMKAAGIEIY